MQAFIERARQALGLGPEAFLPSTLEAQETTLRELDVFAPPLTTLMTASKAFELHTSKFLEATATAVTDTPLPRLWMQGSPSEPAAPLPSPVPAEAAAWFDPSVCEAEAGVVPGAVRYALTRELVAPLDQWLWAHQVAQGRLSELQSRRLTYDADRRRLVQRATAATAAAVAASPASPAATSPPHPSHQLPVEDPAMAQLAEDAAVVSVSLSEFEADVEALDDLLAWLVEGAVRIKATLADMAAGVGAATQSWTVPPGLMPPFPEKSSFGQDLEVTITPSDPSGSHTHSEQVVTSRNTSTATAPHPHHTPTASPAHGTQQQPDLSAVLPADDALVYGGGVPPAGPTPHVPPGGSVGQLVKDTLVAPHDTQPDNTPPGSSAAAAPPAANPDLPAVLPADDVLVYGGGVAPAHDDSATGPEGGGVGQLVKDTLVTPAGPEPAAGSPPGSPSAPEVAPRSSHSYSGAGTGRLEARAADAAAAGLGAGGRRLGRAWSADDTPPGAAAVEGGVGPGGVAVEGQGEDASNKQLSPVVISQPSTSPSTPPAPHSTPAPPSHPIDISSEAADIAGSTHTQPSGATTTTHDNSSSSSAPRGSSPPPGGIWAAIQRTVAEAGVAAAAAAAAAVAGHLPGVTAGQSGGAHPEGQQGSAGRAGEAQEGGAGQTAQQEVGGAGGPTSTAAGEGVWAKGTTPPGGAAANATTTITTTAPQDDAVRYSSTEGTGTTVGGATTVGDSAPVMHIGPVTPSQGPPDPAPGSAVWLKQASPPGGAIPGGPGANPPAAEAALHSPSHTPTSKGQPVPEMHIGPVTPPQGPPQPEPGTAIWDKDATQPGGSGTAGVDSVVTGSGDDLPAEGRMHIGPVTPSQGPPDPAPGSAVWLKQASPPGGTVAAAPAGSDMEPADDERKAASVDESPAGPDLSKILPSYEKGIPEVTTPPEGGTFGTFVKETLLGPSKPGK